MNNSESNPTQTVLLERTDKYGAARILGVSPRTAVALARSIPGTAKIGRSWTFEIRCLREYVRRMECATHAVQPSPHRKAGPVLPIYDASPGLYEETIRRLRQNGRARSKLEQ